MDDLPSGKQISNLYNLLGVMEMCSVGYTYQLCVLCWCWLFTCYILRRKEQWRAVRMCYVEVLAAEYGSAIQDPSPEIEDCTLTTLDHRYAFTFDYG